MANPFARHLRKNPTDAERRLWYHLRRRGIGGHRFRRQAAIGPYIVDFVSFEKRLIIELDGGQHAIDEDSDAERDAWMRSRGYEVLRFWDHEVFGDLEHVLSAIWRALNEERS